MDLFHIKKRIKSRAVFVATMTDTFTPKLSMRLAGVEISTPLRLQEIQDLKYQTGIDIEDHLQEILINEFIANNKFLNKFIQLENRERNLNQLLNEEPDLGL